MANYVFPRVVYDHRQPFKTDDANQGYVVGQPWADLSLDRFWVCVRNTPGDAKWIPVGGVLVVEDHRTVNILEHENLLVYCEATEQVYYSDGDKWMLVTFDIYKVTTLPPVSPMYDNKLVYVESTNDIYYCDGSIWVLLSFRIHNVLTLPSPTDYWEGKLAFQTSNEKMYYCYDQRWIGLGWARGHDFNYGSGNFVGNEGTRTINHGMPSAPGYVNVVPHGNPHGHLGEVWVTWDSSAIYVGNSGAHTGQFYWFAISNAL